MIGSADANIPRSVFSFLVVAGWLNRTQQKVIEYLVEENRILTAQIGRHRLRFTDDQRCRLPKPRSWVAKFWSRSRRSSLPRRCWRGIGKLIAKNTTALFLASPWSMDSLGPKPILKNRHRSYESLLESKSGRYRARTYDLSGVNRMLFQLS